MAHFLGGSQMMRGTWKAAQSTRTFLIQGISAWHGGLGAHPRSLWINTQARVWSVQTETRHSWGKCCLLKLEPPPEDFSDSYQRASPLGAREMAWPGSSILLEKSGCSSKAPWASWWQGGKSQMESPFILSGAVDISKCALRAHFQRHGGEAGGGERAHGRTWWPKFWADSWRRDRLNNNVFCMFSFTPERVLCSPDVHVSASFWRIWSLSEITAQIKAFCSY